MAIYHLQPAAPSAPLPALPAQRQNTALHVAEDVACDQMHVQLLGANLPGVLQVWKMVHL